MLNARRTLLSVTLVALGFVPAACTLSTNATSSQCHSQQDCLDRGGDFADTYCSEERICVKNKIEGRACTHHQECADRNGGAPFICRQDGRCVSLTTADCQEVLADKEDLTNDATVFIGHINTGDGPAALGVKAIDLARSEIKKQTAGGLPPATPDGAKRPLAFIVCTTEPFANTGLGSFAATQRALDHLSTDLELPIQNGPWTPQPSLLGAHYAIDHKLLMFTQNPISELTALDDGDLVFRSGFADKTNLSVLPNLLKDQLVPRAITAGMIAASTDQLKVAIVLDDNFRFIGTEAGKILAQSGLNLDIRTYNNGGLADFINFPNPGPIVAKVISDVSIFKPHIILYAGGPGQLQQVLLPISRLGIWQNPSPAAPGGCSNLAGAALPCNNAPRPFQITTLGVIEQFAAAALASLPGPQVGPVTNRYFGLRSFGLGYNEDEVALWKIIFGQKFPDLADQDPALLSLVEYDVTYLYANAIVANGTQAMTGPNLAKAVRRVADASGGVDVHWGSEGLATSFAALGRGQNLALGGIAGAWKLDKNGERPGNSGVFCVRPPTTAGKIVQMHYLYNIETSATEGTADGCP